MLRALLIAGSAGAALFAVPANAQQVCLSGGPDGSRSVTCGPAFSGLDARGRTELDSRYVRSTTAAAPAGRITSGAYADAPRRNIRSYSDGPDARFVASTSYGGGYGRADAELLGGPARYDAGASYGYRDQRQGGYYDYDDRYAQPARFTAAYRHDADPYYGQGYYGRDYYEPEFRASGRAGYYGSDYRYDQRRIYGGAYVNTNTYSQYRTYDDYRRVSPGRSYPYGHEYRGGDVRYGGQTAGCAAHHYSAQYVDPCQIARDHRSVEVVRARHYEPRRGIHLGSLALTGGVGYADGGSYGGGGGGVVIVDNRSRFSGLAGSRASASASATARANASISVRQSFRGGYRGGHKGGGKGCGGCGYGGGKGH